MDKDTIDKIFFSHAFNEWTTIDGDQAVSIESKEFLDIAKEILKTNKERNK